MTKLAQISKGLLYQYFRNKEELLSAFVDRRIEDVRIGMTAAKRKRTTAAHRVLEVNRVQ